MRLDKGDHRALVLWATDCAEHVLSLFEEQYPQDNRPRHAVEAGRAWARGELALSEARTVAFTAHAAARDAARAAGHAAATAHVASHATHAATYAVTAVSSAAEAADKTAATAKERNWQYHRLPPHLWPGAFPPKAVPEKL